MKNKTKKLSALSLAFALALAPNAVFADGEDVKIYVEGDLLEPTDSAGNSVTPIIIDGTTYLPVRALCDAVGYDVEWNAEERAVYLTKAEVVAADDAIFGKLGHYVDNPYEILGRSAFLDRLKALMGDDYDNLLMPALSTCYALGDENELILHCTAPGKDFVNEAVISVSSDGRIDAAVLSPEDKEYGGKNDIKYYSNKLTDCIDNESIVEFVATHITGNELGYNIIDFANSSSTADAFEGNYNEAEGLGSFAITANGNGGYKFSGSAKRDSGSCTTSGTLKLTGNCAVCMEDGEPSIMFAFSGNYLTVIGLNDTTKVLTSTYKKQA